MLFRSFIVYSANSGADPVDIERVRAGVGAVDDKSTIGRDPGVLHHEIARRQQDRRSDLRCPVQGVVGLAIKAFMVGQSSDNGPEDRLDDYCALGPFAENRYSPRCVAGIWTEIDHLFMPSHALRGLLASAASFVPELRPLVAKAVESPLTVRFDDDEAAA